MALLARPGRPVSGQTISIPAQRLLTGTQPSAGAVTFFFGEPPPLFKCHFRGEFQDSRRLVELNDVITDTHYIDCQYY